MDPACQVDEDVDGGGHICKHLRSSPETMKRYTMNTMPTASAPCCLSVFYSSGISEIERDRVETIELQSASEYRRSGDQAWPGSHYN